MRKFILFHAASAMLLCGAAQAQTAQGQAAQGQAAQGQGAPSAGGQPPSSEPPITVRAPEPTLSAVKQPPAVSPDKAYRINAGDEIEIYVWGDERLQRGLRVLPDGTFAFPLVGTIRAAGRTTTELESELSTRLAAQYRGVAPQVTVSVKNPAGLQVSIIGKVRSPGTLTPGRYITLVEALALAGGPTEFADVSNIVIIRNRDGRSSVIPGKLTGLLKGRPSESDLAPGGIPTLQPGDTVIVP